MAAINRLDPVFVADSCIGGLSVLKSLWSSGYASEAIFLADYEINPLGVKDDAAIAGVVDHWISVAGKHSETLIMACNTLSIRYRQLQQSGAKLPQIRHVISMVDCFEEMVRAESGSLEYKKVLIVGTKYTASQNIFPEILTKGAPGVQVETIAATELERQVARIEPWDGETCSVLTSSLRQAIENTDVAVLACTCFPMVAVELRALFPDTIFLDPGTYCSKLLEKPDGDPAQELELRVTGHVVTEKQAADFARSYLSSE